MIRHALTAALILLLCACGDPYQQGQTAFEEGRWEEAIARLERVRVLDANYQEARRLIARANFQLGKEAYERQE